MSIASLTNTNISDTYQGVLHAGGVPFAATGVQDIYDGYGNTSSLKLGRACEGGSICGTLSADALYVVNPTILFNQLINLIYPVNSIYLTLSSSAPFPGSGTTWTQVSQGRVIAGVGTASDDNGISKSFVAGDNGGKFSMLSGDLPRHSHFVSNTTSEHDTTNPPLSPTNYLMQGGTSAVSNYGYELEGNAVPATVGLTSTTGTSTVADITPLSYGVYVWKRTA
jgi:hypothetical protein